MENKTDYRFNQTILCEVMMDIAKAFVLLNADCQNGSLQTMEIKEKLFKEKAEQTKQLLIEYIDRISDFEIKK